MTTNRILNEQLKARALSMNLSMKYGPMVMLLSMSVIASAADYSVAPLQEGPPQDELSAEVAGRLAATGIRVTRGSSTKYCDIWLCKELDVKPDFKATSDLLYPFTPGQLIGVVRFNRKGADFRDQDIAKGVYTVRYAQQPVDGAHVGTSPTRDFLLLVQAEKDSQAGVLEYKSLTTQSAEAAGSSHPAMLCLQRVTEAAEGPSIRHNENHDWWIVTVQADTKAGGASKPLPMAIVVTGVAPE